MRIIEEYYQFSDMLAILQKYISKHKHSCYQLRFKYFCDDKVEHSAQVCGNSFEIVNSLHKWLRTQVLLRNASEESALLFSSYRLRQLRLVNSKRSFIKRVVFSAQSLYYLYAFNNLITAIIYSVCGIVVHMSKHIAQYVSSLNLEQQKEYARAWIMYSNHKTIVKYLHILQNSMNHINIIYDLNVLCAHTQGVINIVHSEYCYCVYSYANIVANTISTRDYSLINSSNVVIVAYDFEWNWDKKTDDVMVSTMPKIATVSMYFYNDVIRDCIFDSTFVETSLFKGDDCGIRMLEYIFNVAHRAKRFNVILYCFAHNAMSAEHVFMVQLYRQYMQLCNISSVVFQRAKYVNIYGFEYENIVFRDTYQYCSKSLFDFCALMNTEIKKSTIHIDYANIDWLQCNSQELQYCIYDSVSLMWCVYKLNSYLNDIFGTQNVFYLNSVHMSDVSYMFVTYGYNYIVNYNLFIFLLHFQRIVSEYANCYFTGDERQFYEQYGRRGRLYKICKNGQFIYGRSIVYTMNVQSIVGNYTRTIYNIDKIQYSKYKYMIFGFAKYKHNVGDRKIRKDINCETKSYVLLMDFEYVYIQDYIYFEFDKAFEFENNYAYYNKLVNLYKCEHSFLLCSMLKLCGYKSAYNNYMIMRNDSHSSRGDNVYRINIDKSLLRGVVLEYMPQEPKAYNIHVSLYLSAVYNFNICLIIQTLMRNNCVIVNVNDVDIFFVSDVNEFKAMNEYINNTFCNAWSLSEAASTWHFYSKNIYVMGSSFKCAGLRSPVLKGNKLASVQHFWAWIPINEGLIRFQKTSMNL